VTDDPRGIVERVVMPIAILVLLGLMLSAVCIQSWRHGPPVPPYDATAYPWTMPDGRICTCATTTTTTTMPQSVQLDCDDVRWQIEARGLHATCSMRAVP